MRVCDSWRCVERKLNGSNGPPGCGVMPCRVQAWQPESVQVATSRTRHRPVRLQRHPQRDAQRDSATMPRLPPAPSPAHIADPRKTQAQGAGQWEIRTLHDAKPPAHLQAVAGAGCERAGRRAGLGWECGWAMHRGGGAMGKHASMEAHDFVQGRCAIDRSRTNPCATPTASGAQATSAWPVISGDQRCIARVASPAGPPMAFVRRVATCSDATCHACTMQGITPHPEGPFEPFQSR